MHPLHQALCSSLGTHTCEVRCMWLLPLGIQSHGEEREVNTAAWGVLWLQLQHRVTAASSLEAPPCPVALCWLSGCVLVLCYLPTLLTFKSNPLTRYSMPNLLRHHTKHVIPFATLSGPISSLSQRETSLNN